MPINKAYSPFTYSLSIQNNEKRQNHKWENPPSNMDINKTVWNMIFNLYSQHDIQYIFTTWSTIPSKDLRFLKFLSKSTLVKMSATCSDDAQYWRSMTPSCTSHLMVSNVVHMDLDMLVSLHQRTCTWWGHWSAILPFI